jgi:hypothetical protein
MLPSTSSRALSLSHHQDLLLPLVITSRGHPKANLLQRTFPRARRVKVMTQTSRQV